VPLCGPDSSNFARYRNEGNFERGDVGMQTGQVRGRIGTLMARMFGCRHGELSRPFSHGGRAYRSCLNCGAQRQFNLGNWQMQGDFYYRKPSLAN
jgi:hypothetical protein